MASVYSNLNSAMVDDRIVAALRHVSIGIKTMSHIVEDREMVKDNVIRVPLAVDPTVATKTPGAIGTPTGSLTGVNVTLDQFKNATWSATEAVIPARLLAKHWSDQAAGAVHALGQTVLNTAFANVTKANYGDTSADKHVSVPASFMQEDLGILWEKAEEKIKGQDKTFVMNAKYAAAILSQPGLGLLFATAGNNYIQTGQIPTLMGMGVMKYTPLPHNDEHLGGVVMGQAAVAIALAPTEGFLGSGDGNIMDRRVITDPESGLSCMYTVVADGGGTMTGEVAVLFGTAKAQNSIVRLVTAN
jgi:hypothetical protein